MPVLGTTTASASGVVKRGVIIPNGSLDVWKAARNASSSTRCDVAIYGDSTTFGSSDPIGLPHFYPWPMRLRGRSIAAGYADGGYGMVNALDLIGGNVANDQNDAPSYTGTPPSGAHSAITETGITLPNNGDSITITGKGTCVRLYYSKLGGGAPGGRISYTLPGAGAVALDTLNAQSAPYPYDIVPVYLSGLSAGSHAVTVANAGPSTIRGPVAVAAPTSGGAGTLGAGTYYYWATPVSANGEGLPVFAGSITVGASASVNVNVTLDYGHTGCKLYRATSNSSAAAGLVGTTSNSNPITVQVSDTGGAAGAAPPLSNGLGTFASATTVEFALEFLNATGIVYHRDAVSGASSGNFGAAIGGQTNSPWNSLRMGLNTITTTPANTVNTTIWGASKAAKPLTRNVKLAIMQIGSNDIGGATDGSGNGVDLFTENLQTFIRTARAAGADPLIVMPPYDVATSTAGDLYYAGRWRAATAALCLATGTAMVDFGEAVGPVNGHLAAGYGPGSLSGPHLYEPGYMAEADFLWDNVLSQ